MKERYVSAVADLEFVDRLIGNSVNLVAAFTGKSISRRFRTASRKSADTLALSGLGQGLRALRATTAAGLGTRRRRRVQARIGRLQHGRLPSGRDGRGRPGAYMRRRRVRPECGRCRFARCRFPAPLGRFVGALPEFAKINNAAYWDYQRDKIYIRSNQSLQRAAKRKRTKRRLTLPVNTTVGPSRVRNCPGCNSTRVSMNGRYRRIFLDMRFSNGCLRRWVVKYVVDYYKCGDCSSSFLSDDHHLGKSPYSAERSGICDL